MQVADRPGFHECRDNPGGSLVGASLVGFLHEEEDRPQWFAAYTRAKHEKRVASALGTRAVEYFLPLYSCTRRWKDRSVSLNLPLFPGYVFVRLPVQARLRALEIPGVVHLVGFNGRPYPLAENEIANLQKGLASKSQLAPHTYLKTGSRVRVMRGPLEGVQGILVRRKNVHRVVVSLELIARAMSMEIDLADLEFVSTKPGK